MSVDGDGERGAKSADAYRTISEVSDDLDVPQHVLRFWETKFAQIRPLKRAGGRRYYRPEDVRLLTRIRDLLYTEGYTIRGVQRLLKDKGVKAVVEGALADSDRLDDAEGEGADASDLVPESMLEEEGEEPPLFAAALPPKAVVQAPPAHVPEAESALSTEKLRSVKLALNDLRGMAELLRRTAEQ